ncbi:hypothetical protein P5673_004955 [Acropora cervicornis]|uniref:Uncharacterized protein n=1 Tax=Acropora cervicornis TaxID=6130 RepID=A0AAD9QZ44_ACRCE|nr:hypothetical protein P5673_004955 [Acropora cervicornis]
MTPEHSLTAATASFGGENLAKRSQDFRKQDQKAEYVPVFLRAIKQVFTFRPKVFRRPMGKFHIVSYWAKKQQNKQ